MTDKMNEEKIRIDSLLSAGKISSADHAILMKAILKTPSRVMGCWRLLSNPFPRLASELALALGVAFALIMCFVAPSVNVNFPGVLDLQVNQSGTAIPFIKLVVQNLIALVFLSLGFYVAALSARRRNLRLVDFAGYIAFSRLPYLVFVLALAALHPVFPSVIPRADAPDVTGSLLFALFAVVVLVWYMILLFSALREASGLKGGPLWLSYIGTIIVTEVASVLLRGLI
jgi:hypothetical protein